MSDSSRRDQLLQLLADGGFHSGQALAERVGCSRSAVWKQVAALREATGLRIDAVTGRGYRLERPIELLDGDRVLGCLSAASAAIPGRCRLLGSIDSTNALAMQQGVPAGQVWAAWLAEHQSAGRGRHGRTWLSPYGRNLYLSLAWRFELPLTRLAGLSLATGAVLADLLAGYGLREHGLKWPNDLLWQGRKLAGILLEVQGETGGPAVAVIGIGINLDLDSATAAGIDQPAGGLRQAGVDVPRNQLAGDLLDRLLQMCRRYTADGLTPFLPAWRRHDLYLGAQVRLVGASRELQGEHLGIADDGGLRLRTDRGEQVFYGGELSLRAPRP